MCLFNQQSRLSAHPKTPPRFSTWMSSYSDETTAALKYALRRRRDEGYYFSEENIASLTATTGLSREQVVMWAVNVRRNYPSPDEIIAYFDRPKTVSFALCWHHVIYIYRRDEQMLFYIVQTQAKTKKRLI